MSTEIHHNSNLAKSRLFIIFVTACRSSEGHAASAVVTLTYNEKQNGFTQIYVSELSWNSSFKWIIEEHRNSPLVVWISTLFEWSDRSLVSAITLMLIFDKKYTIRLFLQVLCIMNSIATGMKRGYMYLTTSHVLQIIIGGMIFCLV